jgi:hypothetical protein
MVAPGLRPFIAFGYVSNTTNGGAMWRAWPEDEFALAGSW